LIKVFESFDLVEAGRIRSLLEAHGIETFLKNEFLSGALGELPFQEVAPQVWVVHDRDLPRALDLMQQEAQPQASDDGDD
jgi:hypothetical protein